MFSDGTSLVRFVHSIKTITGKFWQTLMLIAFGYKRSHPVGGLYRGIPDFWHTKSGQRGNMVHTFPGVKIKLEIIIYIKKKWSLREIRRGPDTKFASG